jgi:glycosyltransferase involved in cell wall biosynthesis
MIDFKDNLVSISIATFGRPILLSQVLESICQQRFPRSQMEVVVVVDGVDQESVRVCDFYKSKLKLTCKQIGKSGLSSARNISAELATSPIIKFQDDDDVLDAFAIINALDTYSQVREESVAVLNNTTLDSEIQGDKVMEFATAKSGFLFNYDHIPENQSLTFEQFWGGRIMLDRRFFLKHYFDSALKFGAEDIEFAFRAKSTDSDFEIRYAPKSTQKMIRRLSFRQLVERRYLQGISGSYLWEKYGPSEIGNWARKPLDLCDEEYEEDMGDLRDLAGEVDRLLRIDPRNIDKIEMHMNRVMNWAYNLGFKGNSQ